MMEQWHDVAAFSDLTEDKMLGVEVGDTHLILIRDGEDVRALQGKCPHAGAKLEGGSLCDGHIVCPWHMGTFDARDGTLLEPPALQGLAVYPARVSDGRVSVNLTPKSARAKPACDTDARRIVIVGSGAGACAASIGLRAEGYDGEITMIGPVEDEPIDRTQLTKMALSGQKARDTLALLSPEQTVELRVTRVVAEVTGLDLTNRSVTARNGRSFAFDRCILASGATAKKPSFPGADARNVFTIRTTSDVERIRTAVSKGAKVVVLGTSFIGMEAASALKAGGADVTVIGKSKALFLDVFGERIANALAALHQKNGVKLMLGTDVVALHPMQGDMLDVELDGGSRVTAQAVIVGYGVTPNTAFLSDLALTEDGGVKVDRQLRAADGVFAIGDIAAVGGSDGKPLRIEHWRVAEQHGFTAARNALGANETFDAVPFFWTQQHGKRLVYLGHASEWDEVVIDGNLDAMQFVAWYLRDGKVAAALLCGMEHACSVLADRLRAPLTLAEGRDEIADKAFSVG